MDTMTMDEVKALAERQNVPCTSIFMTTHRTDANQNRIRFKNLLGQAEKMMDAAGMGEVDVDEEMKPARRPR